MSYKTLEVELENGHVSPVGPETLPSKAHALLTILDGPQPVSATNSKQSLADRTHDLAGIGRGEYTDLSTNRSHRDDFGQ